MLIKHIERLENFSNLRDEISSIIQSVGFQNNQIACQGLDENQTDWYSGTGSLDYLEEKNEEKYCFINETLKGSYLEQLIKRFRSFRTRIMCMPPRKCYSVHRDLTKRIHIPIVTNDQCWMVWPTDKECFKLLEGRIYLTDTTKLHTYLNGHETLERIHLVMAVEDSF